MLILNAFYKESKVVIKIMVHIQKNIKHIFLAVLLIKLHVLKINLARKLFFSEQKKKKKNAVYRFIESILEEHDYCKKNDIKVF